MADPTLRRGSRGDDVRALQARLWQAGYEAGRVDGIFGALTERAVRRFQAETGLKADGVVGAVTRRALEQRLRAQTAAGRRAAWAGKFAWIWRLEESGRDPAAMAERARAAGLRGVLVKAHDGPGVWRQLSRALEPFRRAGLAVFAWGYLYGRDLEGELRAVREVWAQGVDGYVLDVEAEFEGRPEAAAELAAGAREAAGGRPLGYTTFALPSLHPQFPYTGFERHCDAFLPQAYWALMGRAMTAVWRSMLAENLPRTVRAGVVMAPVGDATARAGSSDLWRFGELCTRAGLPGFSFWSWQHAREEHWQAVGRAATLA